MMRSLLRTLAPVAALVLLVAVAACGGDDDGGGDATPTSVVVDSTLEGQLSSILLSEADIPPGLQGALAFTRNEGNQAPGYLLGAEIAYIPTEALPENQVVRGGIQNSASVYDSVFNASNSYQATKVEAESADWAALYTSLSDVQVFEVTDRTVGEESYWLRVTGVQTCAVETPADASPGPVETFACPNVELTVNDYLIFRIGRTRSLVEVHSSHPAGSLANVYQDQIKAWADIVAQRAVTTFGDAAS